MAMSRRIWNRARREAAVARGATSEEVTFLLGSQAGRDYHGRPGGERAREGEDTARPEARRCLQSGAGGGGAWILLALSIHLWVIRASQVTTLGVLAVATRGLASIWCRR